MIYLIVGQPRHGKSQFCAKMAYEYEQENIRIRKKIEQGKELDPEKDLIRNVYSDIDGHAENCEFVQPAPDDWRDVPEDSVIFMDEIHKRPEYCDSNGRLSQNPMIVDLTEHGHFNKDIVLITQDPERLNKGIRKLIQKMLLVKRPAQLPPFATVYEFDRYLRDPWQALKRPENYFDSYKFPYRDKWQKMYKSASAHTSMKFKIQKKFIYAILAVFILLFLAYVLFTKSGGDKLARNAIGGMKGNPMEVSSPVANASTNQVLDVDKDCRKAENLDNKICKDWYNDLTNKHGSVERIETVSYDPSKPYTDDQITKNIRYEVKNKPVFSGCLKSGNTYTAYTQQGTILHKVAKGDCKRLIDNAGDRPFDFFGNHEQKEQPQAKDSTPSVPADDHAAKTIYENKQGI